MNSLHGRITRKPTSQLPAVQTTAHVARTWRCPIILGFRRWRSHKRRNKSRHMLVSHPAAFYLVDGEAQ